MFLRPANAASCLLYKAYVSTCDVSGIDRNLMFTIDAQQVLTPQEGPSAFKLLHFNAEQHEMVILRRNQTNRRT
jgi:hypothetical protein